MQVNLTVKITGIFLESCSVTVIHRVIAIYRAVVYRYNCYKFVKVFTFPFAVVPTSCMMMDL